MAGCWSPKWRAVGNWSSPKTCLCLAGNGWEWGWGNGIIINNHYGSVPHSLLGTSKKNIRHSVFWPIGKGSTTRRNLRVWGEPCSKPHLICCLYRYHLLEFDLFLCILVLVCNIFALNCFALVVILHFSVFASWFCGGRSPKFCATHSGILFGICTVRRFPSICPVR